jgi:hypothetical protein
MKTSILGWLQSSSALSDDTALSAWLSSPGRLLQSQIHNEFLLPSQAFLGWLCNVHRGSGALGPPPTGQSIPTLMKLRRHSDDGPGV